MWILRYPSKKNLKEIVEAAKVQNGIGLPLDNLKGYNPSIFESETPQNGYIVGSNRPSITRIMITKVNKKGQLTQKLASEFYASLTVKDGFIVKVS
jgi:predicted transglutaminase-like protease